jgi:hypothetical protein
MILADFMYGLKPVPFKPRLGFEEIFAKTSLRG